MKELGNSSPWRPVSKWSAVVISVLAMAGAAFAEESSFLDSLSAEQRERYDSLPAETQQQVLDRAAQREEWSASGQSRPEGVGGSRPEGVGGSQPSWGGSRPEGVGGSRPSGAGYGGRGRR